MFEKNFGLCLDLDWGLKNQDWIWTTKYDSPLISDCSGSDFVLSQLADR